ncbi:MAG: N-acetylmuramoyl-L-alanine amidase [Candidatus Thermoplasmatota archaeon]|nr:N-acetylmuramoyl-L-alanine amidase [Candidatus Thermoplasmatota archaeon]
MKKISAILALFIAISFLGNATAGISGMIVCIDAGHGGSDSGAVGACGLLEKDVNLDVAMRLKDKLESSGARVVMTRGGDYYVSLEERCAIANNAGADIFISIHCNSYSSPDANGIETYWYTYGSSNSERLAYEIQYSLVSALGLRDRGVKQSGFYVIKNTAMPAALAELAFISNPDECDMLSNPGARDACAEAIFRAVLNYAR